MPPPSPPISKLILHTLLLFLLPSQTYSQNDPILTYCSGDSNYTSSSPFKSNLDLLLSNLTTSTLLSTSYFSTATVGSAASAQVYGLAQCLPGASAAACSQCLNSSASAVTLRCPFRKSGAVRFDDCVLRYSDERFFSLIEDRETVMLVNRQNASDATVFNQRLKDLMDEISSNAAAQEAKFGVGITNYSDFGDIYGMTQCTRDLSDGDCSRCLNEAVGFLPSCCYGKIGGQVLKVSCALRFETSPFFSLSSVPPPPSQPAAAEPPPPPPGSSSSADGGNRTSQGGDGKSGLSDYFVPKQHFR